MFQRLILQFFAAVLLTCAVLQPAGAQSTPADLPAVTPPPAELKAPEFYTKFISAHGYPIVASPLVDDYALREAAYLVDLMLAHRPDVRDAMIASGSRLCIIGHKEFTTDLPEFAKLGPAPGFDGISAKDFWDARARGTGGSQSDPYCSCGEENLLGYGGDPYSTECILIHEFAHNLHLRGLVRIDPTFDGRVRAAYDKAMADGLWKGKYASVNHHEYFAEGVQSWFDNNRENDHDHNHVNTRAELVEYDPRLAELCKEVFGDTELKYTKPVTRLTGHMAGYDPAKAPKFAWPERLAAAQAAIRQQAEARNRKAERKPEPQTETATKPQQPPANPLLTLDRIFKNGEFGERGPKGVVWSRRSPSNFTFESPKQGDKGRDLVRNDDASATQEIVVPGAAFVPTGSNDALSIVSFQFSDDESKLLLFTNTQRVWRQNTRGDYWVLDVSTRELKQLGGGAPAGTLMFARFSPDATRVAYVRENNLYVQDLATMSVTPLTTDGSATLINGTADWVNEEELEIRDGFRFSPDGNSIAFWQFDLTGVRSFHLLTNIEGNYSRTIPIPYPKVGEMNSATRLGVVAIQGGPVRWLDLPGDPRNHYIPRMEWTPDSRQILIQQMNRLQNVNLVFLADPNNGTAHTILTERDDAWLENENPVRWLRNGSQFLWQSERNGWRQLYLANRDGTPPTRVTQGDFDVIQIEAVDESGGWVYFAASPENATQRYLYRATLDGSKLERVTPAGQSGWHTYNISPDAHFAIHTVSTITTPPISTFIRLPEHEVIRPLVDNQELVDRLKTLNQPKTEFVKLDIGDGVELDAWVLSPPDIDPNKKYPLLFHVYGEPFGQTVRDAWMGQNGMWHWMLAQQGFVVASVENRGTNIPRGRTWRKCVHRQIGRLAAADQAAAARKLLLLRHYTDPSRVGIWGWSGGGSMSLNAILQYPDLYQTAIAIASVPNQKLYDSIYQERYMGLPDDNAEGYRLGSPITYASQLKGNLLLVHGTGDDNVHYQGVELLMDQLIANHRHFTVMPYPSRSHGIHEGANTYRHLFTLMTRYLFENLKEVKPGPQFEQEVAAVPTKPKGQPGISSRTILGWTVKIDDRLLNDEPKATVKALKLLEAQLEEIVRVVPAPAVEKLREVTLWFSPEYPGTGQRAEYHPGAGWLKENGRNPEMVKGVEFTNVKTFEAETRRMPNFALHELAHGYHDRILGYDHAGIRAAYERAKASGTYDKVERQDSEGKRHIDKAYAMSNPMEYFAELTEAYFSRNDFFPFDNTELKAHDPQMFELLGKLWGVEK